MSQRYTTLGAFPTTRMRRNRRSDWSRRLVAETKLSVDDLIWPVFVQEGHNSRTPVASMPGVDRLSVDLFVEAVKQARDLGIPAIAIFPEVDAAKKTSDA
ncbi:MAG TPA: porphobilinogen synthase, partial [Vineibacter sp.]|nr:porphobilinogen synthase [Vineibacter sp.]